MDETFLPRTEQELVELQDRLGREPVVAWEPGASLGAVVGTFVCFARGGSGPGAPGDRGWAGAALLREGRLVGARAVAGVAGAPYGAGLLALREALLIASAVAALGEPPDLLVVNGTGRDHPRRAGLAVHLGAGHGTPSIGVTHRPLFARGEWPPDVDGARSPLLLDGELVGYWVRLRRGTRPLAVHAGYRTSPDVAVEVALRVTGWARTPEPIREARHAARVARAAGQGADQC